MSSLQPALVLPAQCAAAANTDTAAEAGADISIDWPRNDYSRIPYWIYHDAAIHAREQQLLFRGPVWSLIGFEAEVPKVGDFRSTWLGETPIFFNRTKSGAIKAFVNSCAHRGAKLCREPTGNRKVHACIYHAWSFDLEGKLVGVPFKDGLKGVGGLPKDFDYKANGLSELRVASLNGALFASFHAEAPPLEDYLGPMIVERLRRILHKPIRVLGYTRQTIAGNWKLYIENTRDPYHASLLHQFLVAFGIDRAATQKGGVAMDERHRHSFTYAEAGSDKTEDAEAVYRAQNLHKNKLTMQAPEMLAYRPEFSDRLSLALAAIFPAAVLIQINNSLSARQIRPKGPNAFELHQTLFGYEDDDEAMTAHRLQQANLVGPSGLISLEDAEAIEISREPNLHDANRNAVVEMGGGGAIVDQPHRLTEVPVRGFWSYWAELMGLEPVGGVR